MKLYEALEEFVPALLQEGVSIEGTEIKLPPDIYYKFIYELDQKIRYVDSRSDLTESIKVATCSGYVIIKENR